MNIETRSQTSAGGVAFRKLDNRIEIALISVGDGQRWQLPKGLVAQNETYEAAAIREVHEETGLETELIAPIDKVEYWYYSGRGEKRVRFHKFVYFYLLRYKNGDVKNHDHEVNEARWVDIEEAQQILAFATERKIVDRAKNLLMNGLAGSPQK